ncbi:hypothetical protein THAOC_23936 [Thalassiosira oceanica]|uniref:Uncharacterized protein n=1 Tax=Thalassiosira oceanica TaxID=159749 RepID=K0S5Q9_THAOC|nr:hypothetical protein THAOC_23936 [Thalassiosira oceanica]|eukprot:EJK56221.1 hypothetical protein THAOC_23936 [Thalassiosira oceanica]
MNFFLCDPLRHTGGVRGVDGVYPARPSALFTPTELLGQSVASFDLKQPPSMRPTIINLSTSMCARLKSVFQHFQQAFSTHASGVWGNDEGYPARLSVLYTPTGPLGQSVAYLRRPQTSNDTSSAVDLSAPMCSRPSHEQFFLSRVRLLHAADISETDYRQIGQLAPLGKGLVDSREDPSARFGNM